MVKKILITVLLVSGFIGAMHFERNYVRKECEITHKNDCVLEITDSRRNTWVWKATTQKDIDFYNTIELGDTVELKMHDNFSTNIEDDIVKKVVKK